MKKRIIGCLLIAIFSFCLVGCNNNEEVLKPKNVEEKEPDIEIYSDSEKLVFDANSKIMVFYYKGDKITGMEQYLNEGKSATAKKVADMYNEKEKNPGVKEVRSEGKYVVIVYDDTAYGSLTVPLVRKMYTKEIKK